jgi:DNA polymerase III subunit chi
MRVDMYVIEDDNPKALFHVAVRLLEKAYKQNLRALVLCAHEEEARALDDYLWTYQAASFLPHSLLDEAPEDLNPPIQITASKHAPSTSFDLMLNLCDDIPNAGITCTRLLDLVPHHAKEAGRTRYRAYREQGYPLNNHKIKSP